MNNKMIEKRDAVAQNFSTPASDESINKTVVALAKNGVQAFAFDSKEALKVKLFELLPPKAEVMAMTSVTLDTLGISEEISTKYESVKTKLKLLDKKSQRQTGSTADYSIGSVHAVTQNGEILIASATGSQLSAYAYSSGKIIWVVGTQKIVKNIDEGFKRIYEHCFPLENVRSKKVYGVESKVGKILIINSEVSERLTILFLKQNIGF